MAGISDIPVELFLDNILPLLPTPDLLSLGSTSRFFHLLASDETLWKGKLQADFNFNGSDTARSTGWRFIYKRLSNPQVYVWGEVSHGRLGLPKLPSSSIDGGVPFPVRLNIPGVRVVSLVAGGMSFHALTSNGAIYVWGVLNGTEFALERDGFSEAGKRASFPMRLLLPAPFRSISCGRLHSAALDNDSQVWTFNSWGRPFRLVSPLLSASSPETTGIQVECGWSFTSILTRSSDVLIYWPSSGRMKDRFTEINSSLGSGAAAKPTKRDPSVIPCYVLDMEGIDPVQLPPIPTAALPEIPNSGLSDEARNEETKLIKIAGLDNILIGLTNKGHVLLFNMLMSEDTYQQGHWEYLPYFSEAQKVAENATFSANSERPLVPPQMLCITHISAQFETFVAYSTGPQSVVLVGKPDIYGAAPAMNLKPIVYPALQYKSVISVVVGDYHFGALTSTGKLLTWGAFSKGATGLGDPMEIEPGQPGGYATEAQRQAARNGRFLVRPPDVTVPTEVIFNQKELRKREKYCFAVAAAGWHMGALVIDLEPDTPGVELQELQEDENDRIPGGFPGSRGPLGTQGHVPIVHLRGRGGWPFRIGFAGRGAAPRGS